MSDTINLTLNWSELLHKAVTEPGVISAAYRRFHGYSLGNQLLAAFQCAARDIPLGPIATFMHWKELGRHVKKGQRAIMLCMPVSRKRTERAADDAGNETETHQPGTNHAATATRFANLSRF